MIKQWNSSNSWRLFGALYSSTPPRPNAAGAWARVPGALGNYRRHVSKTMPLGLSHPASGNQWHLQGAPHPSSRFYCFVVVVVIVLQFWAGSASLECEANLGPRARANDTEACNLSHWVAAVRTCPVNAGSHSPNLPHCNVPAYNARKSSARIGHFAIIFLFFSRLDGGPEPDGMA